MAYYAFTSGRKAREKQVAAVGRTESAPEPWRSGDEPCPHRFSVAGLRKRFSAPENRHLRILDSLIFIKFGVLRMISMHNVFRLVNCSGLIAAMILITGCGGSDVAGRYPLHPVSGTVTYQGSPVAGATVMFLPESQERPGASAKTDANGNYQLQTYSANDGAVPGDYKVSIMKWEIESLMGDEDEVDDLRAYEGNPPVALIPEQYANPATSKLTATVTEGENVINFDL